MSAQDVSKIPGQRTSQEHSDRRELLRLRRRCDKRVDEYEIRAELKAAARLLSVRRPLVGA